MRVTYYNRQTKYYTMYSNTKRKALTVAKYILGAAIALAIYGFAYTVLVAAGAQY